MKKLMTLIAAGLILNCTGKQEVKTIQFIPEMTIGQAAVDEGPVFASLNDFAIGPDDRIYCVDGRDKKIKIFDGSGDFISQFGRQGQGPGEFYYPNGIVIASNGDLFITDARNHTLSKFNSSGEFLTSVTLKSPITGIDIFPSGNIVIQIAGFTMGDDIGRSLFTLSLYDTDLQIIKDAVYEKPAEHYVWVTANDQGQSSTQMIPYAPRIVWKIIGSRLYAGYSSEYAINVFDDQGNLVDQIKKSVSRQKVPGGAKNEWIEERVTLLSRSPATMPGILRENLKRVRFPEFAPVFTSFSEIANGFVVIENDIGELSQGSIYSLHDQITETALFGIQDFTYHRGKYYKIIRHDDGTSVLTRFYMKTDQPGN